MADGRIREVPDIRLKEIDNYKKKREGEDGHRRYKMMTMN